jgi:hypothetical protein
LGADDGGGRRLRHGDKPYAVSGVRLESTDRSNHVVGVGAADRRHDRAI